MTRSPKEGHPLGLWLEHVCITVKDLEESIEFYTRVLGFQVLKRNAIHIHGKVQENAYLHVDDQLLELLQSDDPSFFPKPETPDGWINYLTGPIQLCHIGFRTDDLDALIERVVDHGGTLIVPRTTSRPMTHWVTDEITSEKQRRAATPADGNTTWPIAMFADPNGVILEVLER